MSSVGNPLFISFIIETTLNKPNTHIIAIILSLSGNPDFHIKTDPKSNTQDKPNKNINGNVKDIYFIFILTD